MGVAGPAPQADDLAALAMPSLAKARRSAAVARCATDLRVIEDAFQIYAMEHGTYPPNAGFQNGVLPVEMDEYIKDGIFNTDRAPCGGRYRWINVPIGVFAL